MNFSMISGGRHQVKICLMAEYASEKSCNVILSVVMNTPRLLFNTRNRYPNSKTRMV